MIKKALTFAIDFDGVLTNDRRWVISKVASYFGPTTYPFKDLHSKMDVGYMERITKAMSKDFWYTHSKEFESLPICPDAVDVLKKLLYFGHKIHYVTARGNYFSKDYQDRIRKSTKARLEAAGILTEPIIFTANKGEFLRNIIHHDAIIDDDLSHFDGSPILRPSNQNWGNQEHPVEICFGYEAYNADWTGNRISSFYELEAIYPGILNTNFRLNAVHEV